MTHPYQRETDPVTEALDAGRLPTFPPVRVPFGDGPNQTLDADTAAKVLRLMHEETPGLLARYIGIAVTGHVPGAAPRGARGGSA